MTHENVPFSSMEITKEGAQSLRIKMPNARIVFERTHSYLRFVPACSKIARTTVKVWKTRLLSLPSTGASFQLIYSSGEWCLRNWRLRIKLCRWPESSLLSKRALLTCMQVFEHFYKNKASHQKQRQLSGILCRFFFFLYFLSVISAFVIYSDVFHRIIC